MSQEVYLLQTRLQKMPYKHIAAHLKKTELACRLHYHQLSHGTNRRKRAASFSSSCSTHSPLITEQALSSEAELSTAPTTPEQPSTEHPEAAADWKIPEQSPEPSRTSSPVNRTPILPKPVSTLPYPGHRASIGLRLDCNVPVARSRPIINRDRLREVYEAHRVSFWKMIAADYGEGVDPALLEETWRKGTVQGPPTPEESYENAKISGPLMDERVVLPALQPSYFEGSFSTINSRGAFSYPQSPKLRSAMKLPTPSTASTEMSSVPATAISALLNDSREHVRLPGIESAIGRSGDDTIMKEVGR